MIVRLQQHVRKIKMKHFPVFGFRLWTWTNTIVTFIGATTILMGLVFSNLEKESQEREMLNRPKEDRLLKNVLE